MSTQDSFISHLVELRDRLLRAILAVIVVFLCLFYGARDLYALLAKPLLAALPAGGQMIATDVVGVFLVPVKVAFLVAFVIALPYVLYQAWAFVAPGLYANEKRLVLPLVVASSVLFLDRKSTRLNSSHGYISYAVFCLKKKNKKTICCIGDTV